MGIVAVKCLAPAPQQGQGAHLSRDETPNNFMLPLVSCQSHNTNTPQQNSTTDLFALSSFRSSMLKDKTGPRRSR